MPNRINIQPGALEVGLANFLATQPSSEEISLDLAAWIRGRPGWSREEHNRATSALLVALVDARIRETTGG